MKVHSSRKSNIGRTIKITLGVLIIVFLGMLIPRALHLVGSFIMTPVHGVNSWFENSSHVFPSYIRDQDDLIEEINELKNELAVASGEDLTLDRLKYENDVLRKLLNISQPDRIGAVVSARPRDLPYDLLQIDGGWDAGVRVGAPVFIGSDRFIGLVAEVANSYAFVKMFTSPGFEATSFIEGSNVVAIIEGYGGGVARVRVPQGVPLAIGNLVHLPSVEGGVLGRISYIENRPSQPEQYGYITPELSLQSIHFVSVGASALVPKTNEEVLGQIDELISSQLIIEGLTEALVSASSTESNSSSTQP